MMKEDMSEVENELINSFKYVVRSTDDARQLEELIKFQNLPNNAGIGWKMKDAKQRLIGEVGKADILTRLKNTPLLKRSFYSPDRYFLTKTIPLMELLEKYKISNLKLSTEHAMREYEEVVLKLNREYSEFIRSVDIDKIKEYAEQIPSIDTLIEYTKHIMGPLYMDALLVFIQQYSMADVDIYTYRGTENDYKLTKVDQTGFSLAYFGDPGTGKTFATDDLLRGNDKHGIPPHGIIGKLRYAEGMTPKMFIAILEAYQNYPVDWIIPEFRDFFRYQGMVEKLKLVMERRTIKDETKQAVIGPYRVTSFFIVNYNTKRTSRGVVDTISDPNFNAVEDRMICKLFLLTPERRNQIWQNMKRIANGEVEFYLADTLRKHITYTYHQLVHEKPSVLIAAEDYQKFGEEIMEAADKMNVPTSLRIISRGIQIAASAALVSYLNVGNGIYVTERELQLAKEFLLEELKTRSLKS